MLSAGIKQIIYVNDYNNDDLVIQLCKEVGCEIKKVNDKENELNEKNDSEEVMVNKFEINNDLTYFNYWFF